MAYAEFPSTDYSDHDLRELIRLYKKVSGDYSATLQEIKDLSARLSKWETDGNNILLAEVARINAELTAKINDATTHMQNSYDNSIAQLTSSINIRLNEISARYDNLESDFNQKYETLLNKVTIAVETMNELYATQIASIEKSYRENLNRLEEELSKQLDANQQTLLDTITENYSKLSSEMDSKINVKFRIFEDLLNIVEDDVNEKLSDTVTAINKRLDDFESKNSIYGGLSPVFIQFGLSAYDWYNLPEVTCIIWNCSKITCAEWAVSSKYVFCSTVERNFSPISGKKVTAMELINELITKLKICSITAGEYDRRKIKAEEYDNRHITSEKYDWRGDDICVFRKDC